MQKNLNGLFGRNAPSTGTAARKAYIKILIILIIRVLLPDLLKNLLFFIEYSVSMDIRICTITYRAKKTLPNIVAPGTALILQKKRWPAFAVYYSNRPATSKHLIYYSTEFILQAEAERI